MRDDFERDFLAKVVASVLDSAPILANASHAGFIIAGAGLAFAAPASARVTFAISMLGWCAGCWAAVRVAIDTSLFRVMAAEPDRAAQFLDEALKNLRLSSRANPRPLRDRCRGALRLWRYQLTAFIFQICTLAIGAALVRF